MVAETRPRPADDEQYPLVAETLGLWRLSEGIGRGGMGEVYAATYDYPHLFASHAPAERQEEVRREVASMPVIEQVRMAKHLLNLDMLHDQRFAIKVCNARHGTPGFKRFLQEAELAQRLGSHPYIVTVHAINGGTEDEVAARRLNLDLGRHRDLAFMVMDLAVCTFDRTRLSIGEAVHIVRCIAQALDHAHEQGVVHRDLKPENILGTIDHPLLTDFGIAKEIDQSEGLTRTGQIIGTLDYMSPEQATDAKHVDRRSDVYSLGVVLYEFASQGCLPYAHKKDRDSCLAAIRSETVEPRWPREQRPGFPVGLEYIIMRAMAYRAEDRYPSMSEMIADLDRFTRGDALGWYGRVPLRSFVRFQIRHHPRMLWGTVATAAVVGVVALALWLPRFFDQDRRLFEGHLRVIESGVEAVERGGQQQLSLEQSDRLRKSQSLRQDEAYPELLARLLELEQRLLAVRSLKAVFNSDRRGEQIDPGRALSELRLAANATTPSWSTVERGLLVQEDSELAMGPYGTGTVLVWLVVALPPERWNQYRGWQLLRSVERDYPSHHALWDLSGDLLRFGMQEDERAPQVLRQERLTGNRLSLAMELTPGSVRTWVGRGERRFDLVGLRQGAPATVVLRLPAGSALERLEIQPREWK